MTPGQVNMKQLSAKQQVYQSEVLVLENMLARGYHVRAITSLNCGMPTLAKQKPGLNKSDATITPPLTTDLLTHQH